jgi:hypothetical protein
MSKVLVSALFRRLREGRWNQAFETHVSVGRRLLNGEEDYSLIPGGIMKNRVIFSIVAVSLGLTFGSPTFGDPHRPVQAQAPSAFDAGVMRMEVVDEGRPLDPLHGVMVGPRILVGVVYYPIERSPDPGPSINLSYYYDVPQFESYSRSVGWRAKVPSTQADGFLNLFGSSIEAHLNTERTGIYAGVPIARGRFPVVIQFNGSAARGHQGDDFARAFARRGYIYIALDAPGVSSLTPLGRVDLESYPALNSALEALPPCEPVPNVPPVCFNAGPDEYGVADDGAAVWMPPGLPSEPWPWEAHEIQRARDGVAALERIEEMFPGKVDTNRVGIVGLSLGGPPAFVAPQLINALREVEGDRYAAYGIVPTPFTFKMIGDDSFGQAFGGQIGEILCDGAPGCDPIEAVRQLDFPVGIHIAEEDVAITGTPGSDSSEWNIYNYYPGYGPGLTPAPSPDNRSPANLITFQSVSDGVPALWVQTPDSDHLSASSDPIWRLIDDFIWVPETRLFPPYDPYEPLPLELVQEIAMHYAVAFFDLTLNDGRGALGALKTGRYRHVTPDGRGVTVIGKSLEVRLDR